MRAVVLVGGQGTRLRPLTDTIPKQMLPIVEVPMIERVLGWLASHGVSDAVLSMGYRPDAFLSAYRDGRCAGVTLTYAVEAEPLGTGGGIRFAAEQAGIDETFLAVNGDVLTDADIGELVGLHRRAGAEATIQVTPVEDPSAFGVVPTDADGRVLEFVEKPPRDEAPTNLINAGTYVLEPGVLRAYDDGRLSIERVVFPDLAGRGRLYALASERYWIDTGTPATYLRAQLDVLDGRRGPSPGSVVVGHGACIDATAIVEHSVVGADARVEAGAEVRGSVLLAGAEIGDGALVVDSIVGPRGRVGANARVVNVSVLGADAVVEPGSLSDGARVGAR